MAILESINLSKTHGCGKNTQSILKHINLSIEEGECVSIMGPSGSGKSTLLYNLCGMDKMTSGEVIFQKQTLSSLSEKELSKLRLNNIGFIFQQTHLLGYLTVFDNIILPACLAKKYEYSHISQHAERWLEILDIKRLKNQMITRISGGQRQKVAICRALINHPTLILGDEPTGALNSKSASEVTQALRKLNQMGTTIVIATHDLKIAANTERVIYLFDGQIIDQRQFGKCVNDKQLKQRISVLHKWLSGLGF